MKKNYYFLLLLFVAMNLTGQNNCNVVCHNGTVLSGVNDNAIDGHLKHGDTFITLDCDYVETGTECQSLGVDEAFLNQRFKFNRSANEISISGASSITIYNINGSRVLSLNEEQISVSRLPHGLYILYTDIDNRTYRKKILF